MTIKKGTTLICTDPCVMEDTELPALTLGKVYHVKSIEGEYFVTVNDAGVDHNFEISPRDLDQIFFKEVTDETLD